jgi:hypothetical protein
MYMGMDGWMGRKRRAATGWFGLNECFIKKVLEVCIYV